MWSCSRRARSVEPSLPTWITITDREPISRWGRTRPSPDPFSPQEWDASWPYPRSEDYTTATNDGLPKTLTILTIGVDGARRLIEGLEKLTRCLSPASQSLTQN
jgi:hypothetical protein